MGSYIAYLGDLLLVGVLMTNNLGMRRTVYGTIWIIGAALVLFYVAEEIANLKSRAIDSHVRGYAELVLHALGIFGIAALLQGFLCFRPIQWLRSASRLVSVLILAFSSYWILFAAYTGTITSEPWLLVLGFAAFLLASLGDLFSKS